MRPSFFIILASLIGTSALACPSKPQSIKVIDLKSGWWQGDGGDTDQYVLKHMAAQCPNVTFFYQHALSYGGGFGGGFGEPRNPPKEEAKDYDQIWLLSGGEADSVDLRINSAEFQNYLKLMTESSANIFVGTGFGNVYHANALTQALGLGNLAITHREVKEFPSPMGGVRPVSEIGAEQLDRNSLLFAGMSSLPDLVRIGEFTPPSDELTGVTTLATDSAAKTVIGQVTVNGRKMILDANLARTYLIRNGDVNIQKYLENLATALER